MPCLLNLVEKIFVTKSLWAKILISKYLHNTSLHQWLLNRRASHIWRGILKTRDFLNNGIKWTLGDDSGISLWEDWWVSSGPLASNAPGPHVNKQDKVSSIITDDNECGLSAICNLVPQHVQQEIIFLQHPHFQVRMPVALINLLEGFTQW